jgi:hypothetical protein
MKNEFNLENLEHYMFTKNHIMELCFDYNDNKNKSTNKYQPISLKKNKTNDFFIPKEKDTLFWCYYIIVNGIQNYEVLFGNTYKEEKQQKLNFIEKIRSYKDTLKKHKFKRTDIEADIAYSNEISLVTFLAMCAVENKNVCVLKGRCLYTLIINNTSCIDIITMNNNNRYGCFLLEEKEKTKLFNEYTAKYWMIDNIAKPISAQSSYKLVQLQDIADKLRIPIVNENDKKLKKIELYKLIKQKI